MRIDDMDSKHRQIIVVDDTAALAEAAAQRLLSRIAHDGRCSVCLTGGSSPEGLYRLLAEEPCATEDLGFTPHISASPRILRVLLKPTSATERLHFLDIHSALAGIASLWPFMSFPRRHEKVQPLPFTLCVETATSQKRGFEL